MTQVNYPDATVNYGLDKVGNRLSETIDDGTNTITKTYSYNNRDQLTGIVGSDGLNISYQYDNAGNQTEMNRNGEITTFDYSSRQRVKTITKNSIPIHYKYDYLGNRIEKSSNGQTTKYTYDGTSLLYETNTIGNVLAKYHYGSDRMLAETRNNQNSYVYHDALRTTIFGSTNMDMKAIISELGDIESFGVNPNTNGFNVLNVSDDTLLNYQGNKFWTEINKPMVDVVTDRGDNILMATRPGFDVFDNLGHNALIRVNRFTKKRELTGLGLEYLELRRKGFKYINGKIVK